MADNNNSNNQYDANRVSTVGLTIFDNESMMMRLSYLGDALSIMIAEPENNNGKNSYPEKNRHSTLITSERAAALYDEIILKGVIPALEKGEDYSMGIFLNQKKTSILQIRVQDKEIYLVLCLNINEERVSENSYVFHFQKTDVISDYNPNGSFESQDKVEGYFYLFVKWLENGVGAITGAAGHSMRKANSYTTNSFFNYAKSIAAKLGVTPPNNNNYRSNNGGGSDTSGFMNIPEGSPDEMPFNDTPTASSMDDILS